MLNLHIRNRNTEPLRNDRYFKCTDWCTVSLALDNKGNPQVRFQYRDEGGELKVLYLGMREFISVKIDREEKPDDEEEAHE